MKRMILIALLSLAVLSGMAAEQGHPVYSSEAGAESVLSRQDAGQAVWRNGGGAQALPVVSAAVFVIPQGDAGGTVAAAYAGTAPERWREGGGNTCMIALNGYGVLKPDEAPNRVMRC